VSRFRVYLKQFDEDGNYLADFTEITRDVSNLGSLSQQLDNTEYGIGVFRNSGFTLKMRNDEGLYSEADTLKSIFKFKRSDSIVKITWDFRDYDLITGFFYAGEEVLTEEVEIFRGLIADVSSSSDIKSQDVSFQVLGLETLLDREIVPFDDISDGDNISDILYVILNQAKITELLTVDALNISVGIDTAIDMKESLENKTVKEAISELLFLSNSVLRIESTTIYVSNRDESIDDKYSFYGQASNLGLENVINISKFRDGLNRTFNFWSWDETALFERDTSSIDIYGVMKNTIESELIDVSSTTKIQNILDDNRTVFAFPKTEFDLETPIRYETLALNLLDKVSIDYPTVYTPADNNPLPRYGVDVYEDPVYPFEQWSLNISSVDRFKIISKQINTQKSTIVFSLRKV
jgi:hypothetical protein